MMNDNKSKSPQLLESLVSLCKRRGFVYHGSEIYGGLAGTWDYGPLGAILKRNIIGSWWRHFLNERKDMYALDAALLMNQKVWQASGHEEGFADPLVECVACKKKYKKDDDIGVICPDCGGALADQKMFRMMFETHIGALKDSSSLSYLRPETAQGIFVNFKNVLDSFHPRLPFGIAQAGKAFRNEINPRDFLFRTREFEQMEIEYFVHPDAWEEAFRMMHGEMKKWFVKIGIAGELLFDHNVPDAERAHYSKKTIDIEFEFPMGKGELAGLAYRTDFDLKNHADKSGVDLMYYDEESHTRFFPHVIEPSFGVDRAFFAVLSSAYGEDDLGGDTRIFLKFPAHLAPIKVAVFPLLKNKPSLVAKAEEIYAELFARYGSSVSFDDNGNIGKRYRRQDEIGTPFCVTVDFTTVEDGTVTVRKRDTGAQTRVAYKELLSYFADNGISSS